MKTKGDTVTCSQASKSYYKIADHSSAIEWSACFCGEKEQQDRCQQENLQCFLPHLHHLPSHEMRWDFGGLTTKVTVSRMGHYIILRRTLSMLSKPPRCVSHTLAGWLFRCSRLDKSRGSAIMKTKGDTVTCSQAPDLIANMLHQLIIRLPSSGQHAFVESASSKIAASRRTCNAFFHICTTSLRMKCAGMGGLTTKVTVSRMGYCIIF